MSNKIVASLLVLLGSGVSLAQSPIAYPFHPEQACLANKSDLMARSDMQAPRAIPVVKQLRFQEIPVSIQLDNQRPLTPQLTDGRLQLSTAQSTRAAEQPSVAQSAKRR